MTTTDVTALAAPYQPGHDRRNGLFIVLEGISGSGKPTLAALLARQLGGRWFHTVPAPVSDLQPYINASARPLPQLAFYLAGCTPPTSPATRCRPGTWSPTDTSTPSSPTTPPSTTWTTTP
jgi:hypothetical protein